MMTATERRQHAQWKAEVQDLRARNQELRLELAAYQRALYQADRRIDRLEQRVARLEEENKRLKQRVADLTPTTPPPTPAFVKPNVPRRRRRPGRPEGHPAALRPPPPKIHRHKQVPLPAGPDGQSLCPDCRGSLRDVEQHQRVVEEIIPAKVRTTCYHTLSGYCPACDKVVESRAPEQPPPADLPHAQLGLNVLAMAATLRVQHHLPYRQVSAVLENLAGLKVSPAGLSRQINRLGRWFEPECEHIRRQLRQSEAMHIDESGWRIGGRNHWLWTLCSRTHTLFHIDRSRGGKVARELVGKAYDGCLVSDFYSAYSRMNCRQQRCLTHLLRELHETAQRSEPFARSSFRHRCRRLCKDMLLLKSRQAELAMEVYERRVGRLERRLEELAATQSEDADVARLAGRLRACRGQLTPFLHEAAVEGTNSRAERSLRPMVVTRKISGGSRSPVAAKAFAAVASVAATASQQGRNVLHTIKALLKRIWRGDDTPLLSPSQ